MQENTDVMAKRPYITSVSLYAADSIRPTSSNPVWPPRDTGPRPKQVTYPVDNFKDFESRLVLLDPLSTRKIRELYDEIEDETFRRVGRRVNVRIFHTPTLCTSYHCLFRGTFNLHIFEDIRYNNVMEAASTSTALYHLFKESIYLIRLYLKPTESIAKRTVKISLPICNTAGCCLSEPLRNATMRNVMFIEKKYPQSTILSDKLFQMLEAVGVACKPPKYPTCRSCARCIMKVLEFFLKPHSNDSLAQLENPANVQNENIEAQAAGSSSNRRATQNENTGEAQHPTNMCVLDFPFEWS